MKNVPFKSLVVCAFLVAAMTHAAEAAPKLQIAVKAQPGLTLMVDVRGGKNSKSAVGLFSTDDVTKRTAEGLYLVSLPDGFDLSKARQTCAMVMQPKALRYTEVCTPWGRQKLPKDGVFFLELE